MQRGLPNMQIVGLPDAAIKESKERVRSALGTLGVSLPRGHVTVSLAPAEIKKIGSSFDLSIALALLKVQGHVGKTSPSDGFIGELGLDGTVRPVRGALALALGLKKIGIKRCFASRADAFLLSNIPGLEVVAVDSLAALVELLKSPALSRENLVSKKERTGLSRAGGGAVDSQIYERLDDLIGLELPKRVLKIAAAGGHHMLMVGPPGTGKTALARCLAGLLPHLAQREQIQVNAIWNLSPERAGGWQERPPWRAPHHSSSASSILGGGVGLLPGEISLAHLGVLFLDELPEFHRDVLEQLRQPLEEGQIRLARANQRTVYPANFQLICASNPCPCGFLNDRLKACTCGPAQVRRYQNKLSGPILDRLELKVWVPRTKLSSGAGAHSKKMPAAGEAPEQLKALTEIRRADQRQKKRAKKKGLAPKKNAHLSSSEVRKIVPLDNKMLRLLNDAEDKIGLSPRAYVKTLKVARTIADLADCEQVDYTHIAEALSFRLDAEVER